MTIQKTRGSDVVGFLNPRPVAVAVRAGFGLRTARFIVHRFQFERHGIKPDPSPSRGSPC